MTGRAGSTDRPPSTPSAHLVRRPRRALLAAATALLTAAAGLAAAAPAQADDPQILRGADLPFTTRQAEDAATNGTVLGPDRTFGQLPAEASGREAVRLDADGEYVEFTLTEPANSIVVRYSIPDNAAGTGISDSLSLYVDGAHDRDLDVTSQYAWYYGSYPFTNNPSAGNQHHFYDDTRALLGRTLPAGTEVRLQVDAGDDAPWYVIDLVDFEQVAPPAAQPAGSLSVTEFGADPTGAADSSNAFDAAVAAGQAQDRTVWIPAGSFRITRHIVVHDVTIRGAGPWHSVLTGNGVGIYGRWTPASTNVHLHDFAIFGDVRERNDGHQINGIGGAIGGGSVISNIWIEHTKVGMWFDGPMDGITVTGARLRNLTADGLNFHRGVSNAVVENTHVRNSGDDGLAIWSHEQRDHRITLRNNTVELPILANGIAVYGGDDITVVDNVVRDTLTQGGGLHAGNRHTAIPADGPIRFERNTLERAGVLDPNWQFGVGALWFYALDAPMDAPITVRDIDIIDASYPGIHFIGNAPITNITFEDVTINGAGTFALQLQAPGSASFSGVTATGLGADGIYDCQGAGAFQVVDAGGNSGWDTRYCGPWPEPGGEGPGPGPDPEPGANLARGRSVSASSQTGPYGPANAVDGDAHSYWESANGSFPQQLTVDLGAVREVDRVVLRLPPLAVWERRSQRVAVLGGQGTSGMSTLSAAADRVFDPAQGNDVEIDLPDTGLRYLRLEFTANTGWPAGQASEVEVYAPA
ncbi:discoidin domain-containing protein [Allonocardiopsis opalescens]|uniref:F5/8 type C domain-containing protein n=1 Tax=Allonocardiopsis opalescens TaxID=1144618 RepID=A0A2T0QEA8_9ACTN|nr:discoidin domain-containing protein [Allonocardiopsis opalescens]PRY02235.1 F5/8 type C domain-containing protein [Allonocardiopsis opalescens]